MNAIIKKQTEMTKEQRFFYFFNARRLSKSKLVMVGSQQKTIIINYHLVDSNGKGMDAESGVFTTPINGTYVFCFNGVSDAKRTQVSLIVNGKSEAKSFVEISEAPLTMSSILRLKIGDQVSVKLVEGKLFDDSDNGQHFYTQFSAFLLSADK